jgi:D-alanyl-D-alanine carboxypeptidase
VFRYSNTDYLLLGLIIERATGQRLEAQLWQRILKPLGLTDTELPGVDPVIRGPHATGYTRLAADFASRGSGFESTSPKWIGGASRLASAGRGGKQVR